MLLPHTVTVTKTVTKNSHLSTGSLGHFSHEVLPFFFLVKGELNKHKTIKKIKYVTAVKHHQGVGARHLRGL